MPCVAKVDTALVCSFVATILQANNALTSTQLLFSKLANILLCLLRANAGFSKIVCLREKLAFYFQLTKLLWFFFLIFKYYKIKA